MTPVAKSVLQAALLALLLFALGAGFAGFWQQERQRAAHDAKASAALLSAARARLQALRDPKAEDLAGRLAEMYAQGFFAAAAHDDLSSRLQEARKALGMVEAHAVFSPEEPWGNGATPLWQGELELELGLNHEQEFADFWRALAWPGPMRVTACVLERNPGNPIRRAATAHALSRPAPNLKAVCHLQWLTRATAARN
ncbi:MAG: hypothetical protein LBF51_07455 [Zoogloeaceae bacterium]|jgi:hypothetical protein|nr:hypothetical protein [Zoogloeaceae bacterium]